MINLLFGSPKIMKDGEETATKRGTKMMKGKCPDCGTTVCRIGGK